MRLLTCSNSGPAGLRGPGGQLAPGAAGGLIPHLLALLDAHGGGEWFFPASRAEAAGWPVRVADIGLHPVVLAEQLQRLHYRTVSIETLLWLFHYLHDTSATPVFDAGLHHAWTAYQAVNELFAEAVVEVCGTGPDGDSVILVNDYHLLLVPAGLTGRLPAGAKVVYAHQVPWCEPDYFAILPNAVRRQILLSLLSCHTVVFHCVRWRDAFARCCDRYLPEAIVDDELIEHHGQATRLRAVPLPLDAAEVLRLREAEGTRRWCDRIEARAGGRRLLVRVDRLDLWKNHLRGFAAFHELLGRHPHLAGEVWFLVVLTPARYRSPRHRAYEAACRTAAAQINQPAVARGRPEPVTLLYPDGPQGLRARAVAALSQAATVLVNPTLDGFNLVAKEAALVGQDPAILLSRTAGSYDSLAPAVLPVDPFDVTATAELMHSALVAGTRPDPARAAPVRTRLRLDNAGSWLAAVLDDGAARQEGVIDGG